MKYFKSNNVTQAKDEDIQNGIMIVDDSKFSRNILIDILKNEGFQVVAEAKNGLEAIDMTKEKKPKYIFLDVEMPVLDGLGALPKILEVYPEACIIMCTAMGQKNIIVEAAKAGAKDYVLKPYKKENIIRVLSMVIEAEVQLEKERKLQSEKNKKKEEKIEEKKDDKKEDKKEDKKNEKNAKSVSEDTTRGNRGSGKELVTVWSTKMDTNQKDDDWEFQNIDFDSIEEDIVADEVTQAEQEPAVSEENSSTTEEKDSQEALTSEDASKSVDEVQQESEILAAEDSKAPEDSKQDQADQEENPVKEIDQKQENMASIDNPEAEKELQDNFEADKEITAETSEEASTSEASEMITDEADVTNEGVTDTEMALAETAGAEADEKETAEAEVAEAESAGAEMVETEAPGEEVTETELAEAEEIYAETAEAEIADTETADTQEADTQEADTQEADTQEAITSGEEEQVDPEAESVAAEEEQVIQDNEAVDNEINEATVAEVTETNSVEGNDEVAADEVAVAEATVAEADIADEEEAVAAPTLAIDNDIVENMDSNIDEELMERLRMDSINNTFSGDQAESRVYDISLDTERERSPGVFPFLRLYEMQEPYNALVDNYRYKYLWGNRFDLQQEDLEFICQKDQVRSFHNTVELVGNGYSSAKESNASYEILCAMVRSYLYPGRRFQLEDGNVSLQQHVNSEGDRIFVRKIFEDRSNASSDITMADILKRSDSMIRNKLNIQKSGISGAMEKLVEKKAWRTL